MSVLKKGLFRWWTKRKIKIKAAEFLEPTGLNLNAEMPVQDLRTIFMQKDLFGPDGLNEYDEDYTRFKPLCDIVTREMLREAERMEKKRQNAVMDEPCAEENNSASGDHPVKQG